MDQQYPLFKLEGTIGTVHGERTTQSNKGRWETAISVLITATATVIAMVAGAPDKWLAAIFATVVTFGGLLSLFRHRWALRRFWSIVAGLFVLHLAVIWLIFSVLLRQRNEVGLIVCVPFMLVEYVLLYNAVKFLTTGDKTRSKPGEVKTR